MPSKIQKNRIRLLVFIFLALTLIITVPILVFNYWQSSVFYQSIQTYNKILDIHNTAFSLTKEGYEELSKLTEKNTLSFNEVKTLQEEKEILSTRSIETKIQKNNIEKLNLKLIDLKKELSQISDHDFDQLHSKVALSLEKYKNFNLLIFNFLDFYSCQLDNLAIEKEIEINSKQYIASFQNSQNREDLVNSAEKFIAGNQELIDFLPNYQNCFNTQGELIKAEKENFYQVLTVLIENHQSLNQNLNSLVTLIKNDELEKLEEKIVEIGEIENQIKMARRDFKQKLREVLNRFDKEIEKTDLELANLSQEIQTIADNSFNNK